MVRRAMAKDPSERYPSAGDLGQAALVAAGGLRRANPWSVVATGEAAPSAGPIPGCGGAGSRVSSACDAAQGDALRRAVRRCFAGRSRSPALAMVAAGMVAALHGISTL